MEVVPHFARMLLLFLEQRCVRLWFLIEFLSLIAGLYAQDAPAFLSATSRVVGAVFLRFASDMPSSIHCWLPKQHP